MSRPFAILDTNVYIDHWQSRSLKDLLDPIKYRFIIRQCSVVLHELRRGAMKQEAVRLVDDLLRYSPEIINPTDADWWQAAQFLSRLSKKRSLPWERLKKLQNDCLIAFCARRIGGVVVTSDKKDFKILENSLPCRVIYL